MFPTLKTHLCHEFYSSELVYERIYPDSVPTSQKLSLLFTQLFKLKRFHTMSSELTQNLDSLESYYKLKDEKDETLIFESRFECGNLCLALKVS